MSVIPDKKVEQLQFCESHWPIWLSQLAAIGVSQLQIQNFKTLTMAARAAFVVALGMGGGGLTATMSPASVGTSTVKMAA